jgi:hypothetical protein
LVPFAPGPANPSSEPEIRKAYDMVGMMVGKKHSGNFAEGNPQLKQPLHGTATGIDDEFVGANFDESAGAETV